MTSHPPVSCSLENPIGGEVQNLVKKKRFRNMVGFTLVEVTLALGLSSFCLVALFGLLPVGLKINQAAVEQTAANRIISEVAADLRTTPSLSAMAASPGMTTGTTSLFAIQIPSNPVASGSEATSATLYFDGDGQSSKSLTAGSTHRLVVSFLPNGLNTTSNAKAPTLASLQVTWPAAAPQTTAAGLVRVFVALDRN